MLAKLKRGARNISPPPRWREPIAVLGFAIITAVVAVRYEAFEHLFAITQEYEDYELDELFTVLFCMGLAFIVLFVRRTIQLRREIVQREAAEAEAHALARHDMLTGLPNRRGLGAAIDRAISQSDADTTYAVLMIDLDRFKVVNDIHGHALGDAVLCIVAERLKGVVGRADTLARLGGDEFVALVRCDTGSETAMRVAERIISAIGEPIVVEGATVEVGATIGIALCAHDGSDAASLLHAADLAMYRAKRDGRGAYAFFERGMDVEVRARAALETDLKQAVAVAEIRPHYQPLVLLADNQLVGFEVLARWQHPTRGNVEPGVFIPIAEDTGLIPDLTYSLLRQACLDAKNWPSHLFLSVNISPTQLRDRSLPQRLLGILTETGFAPGRLEIEITENALVADLEAAKSILVSLQNVGVRVALDDFGTGYSSLYHLRELKFDKLKLDRSFVQAMDDPESAKIVKAVISLGKSLGLPTTAEGIETADHLDQLVQLDCEVGQGYFLGRPMPASQVTQLLKRQAGAEITRAAKRAVA